MSSMIPATSTLTLAGIDVSHHQGEVNWHAVAEAGISFAFAKATEGATFVDPQFLRNWALIKDAGIVRGAYHFFRPSKPAESQVTNFLTVTETSRRSLTWRRLPHLTETNGRMSLPRTEFHWC
jgi:GH25 family lysozyme M1 (1,4-beta-N-acetylmuramidase)